MLGVKIKCDRVTGFSVSLVVRMTTLFSVKLLASVCRHD